MDKLHNAARAVLAKYENMHKLMPMPGVVWHEHLEQISANNTLPAFIAIARSTLEWLYEGWQSEVLTLNTWDSTDVGKTAKECAVNTIKNHSEMLHHVCTTLASIEDEGAADELAALREALEVK